MKLLPKAAFTISIFKINLTFLFSRNGYFMIIDTQQTKIYIINPTKGDTLLLCFVLIAI